MSFTYDYERPAVTTDLVLFSRDYMNGALQVALITRHDEPYKGWLALPGGYVEINEECESACRRESFEEIGYIPQNLSLVGVFDKVNRDKRGRVITVAYTTYIYPKPQLSSGDDAASVNWYCYDNLTGYNLAFDHRDIIDKAYDLIYAEFEDFAA